MAKVNYNVLALKKEGLSDEDIARFISEDSGADYNEYVAEGLTPKDIIRFANEQDYSTSDVLKRGFLQGATSTYRGARQLAGAEPTNDELLAETEYRQMQEQNPWAAYSSNIIGNIFGDPTNLVPGSLLFKGAKGAMSVAGRLGALGAATGAVEPRYDEEEDPSRLTSALVGGVTTGILGGGIAKLTGFGKTLPDVSETAFIKEADSIGIDVNGNQIKATPGVFDNAETPTTINQPGYVQTAEQGVPNVIELPKLPQFLSGAKPSFFTSPVAFETDLDKALYIIANPKSKSKNNQDYLDFVKTALNVDDATASKLALQVRQEVIDKGRSVQKEAGLAGKKAETVPFQMSKTLDGFLNPVDKNLDDFSKMVYNYGTSIEEVNGKAKVTKAMTEDYSFKKISEAYAQQGIKVTPFDVGFQVRGYTKMLDELKDINGRNFKPKSFEEYVKNGASVDETLDLFARGAFDGCIAI
jgi:hypothetical protein